MSDQAKPSKRKRRWLRYSLRLFLVVLTLGCLLLGYWVHRAERQRAAVKWVETNGGNVWYDFQLDEKGGTKVGAKPPGPEWLHAILGDDYLSTVVAVYLQDTKVTDLTPLSKLTSLETLDLDGTNVNDLRPLAGLPSLWRLSLDDTQVTDVSPLTGLKSLEYLSLGNTPVSKDQLRSLQNTLPSCRIEKH